MDCMVSMKSLKNGLTGEAIRGLAGEKTAVRGQSGPRDGSQERQRCNCSLPNPGGSSQSSGGGADEQFPSCSSKHRGYIASPTSSAPGTV